MPAAAFATTIRTQDVRQTADFYVRYFGFTVRFDSDWFITMALGASPYELCIVSGDSEQVDSAADAPITQGLTLGMAVEDVRPVHDALINAGQIPDSAIRDEPWGQRHFFCRDPAGTLIDVVQSIPADPSWRP